ncbi:hypothetical protein F5146DRAFT_1228782 [Armillaria mellea]|nr:hypothetical protein F5146DRAFT_1228782 [Armillaria mellea]
MVGVATALRPYPCLDVKCKKSFTREWDLKRHGKTHFPKEKMEAIKYPCTFPGCHHKSLQLTNLKTHMNKKHYNVKNRECSFCAFKTADASALTRHKIDAHRYKSKKRLPRQKSDGTTGEDSCDKGQGEGKGEDIVMASQSLELPPSPQSMTSDGAGNSGMELDTPPLDNHNVGADVDMADVPVPLPSPTFSSSRCSTSYAPPPSLTSAPCYVASPPRDTDSDLPPRSSSPPSHHRSMSYTPPPTKTRLVPDRAYLPSPPRSPSPHTSATSLLGLPAELFITGPKDCQLPRIMSYAD